MGNILKERKSKSNNYKNIKKVIIKVIMIFQIQIVILIIKRKNIMKNYLKILLIK